MAFNFRPKTADEIIDAGKAYSLQAASIYSFIKKKYKTTIILDPTKDFSQIKIPRVVEEQVNISQLKDKIDEIVNAKKLSIAFGNGSGPKTGGTDAVETAKQENCTRLACESFIEKGKMPTGKEFQKIYKGYDDEWAETFKLQAESLKGYLKSNKGYQYSRDDGIMPEIESFAKQYCGVNQMDNWNPADIYIVKKNQITNIKKKIEEEFNNVLSLLEFEQKGHDIFRRWYVDGRLFYHKIIDNKNPRKGIQELRYIDPTKIKKVREVKKSLHKKTSIQMTEKIEEYYIYNEK